MSLQNSPPARGGAYRKPNNTPHYNIKNYAVNGYVLGLEKTRLARMLIYGEAIHFRDSFIDPRHQIIYSNLRAFLSTFPVYQYNTQWFIEYLNTTPEIIDKAGGAAYVRSIFQGIGESNA